MSVTPPSPPEIALCAKGGQCRDVSKAGERGSTRSRLGRLGITSSSGAQYSTGENAKSGVECQCVAVEVDLRPRLYGRCEPSALLVHGKRGSWGPAQARVE